MTEPKDSLHNNHMPLFQQLITRASIPYNYFKWPPSEIRLSTSTAEPTGTADTPLYYSSSEYSVRMLLELIVTTLCEMIGSVSGGSH